jgi:hypothetical protein
MTKFGDQELRAELRRSTLLAELCDTYGYADAQNVHATTAQAIKAELQKRGVSEA